MALVAFLAFLAVLFRNAVSGPRPMLCLGFFFVLFGDLLATHNALTVRIHDIMLVLCMAIGSTVRSTTVAGGAKLSGGHCPARPLRVPFTGRSRSRTP